VSTTLTQDHEPEPEGECVLRVDRVTPDDDRLVWSFTIAQGKCQGSKLQYCTMLYQDELWKLRNLLETLGIEVREDGPTPLDLNEFAGLTVGGEIHEGRIIDFWPVDEDAAAKDPEFTSRTRQEVDKARADLDHAIDRYVKAKIADSEDIERWQWRRRP
jgi:hypothetical protein